MTEIRRWIRPFAALVVVLLLGAACASDDGGSASGGSQSGSTGTAASASTGATGSSDGGGRYGSGYGSGGGGNDNGGGGGGIQNVDVQANNFAFDPTTLTVESGEDIHVRDGNANTPHTFTIDGTDVDIELAPLETEEVTIDLDPGTYQFHCRFHPQMTGTIKVK